MRFKFSASDFGPITFSPVTFASRNSHPIYAEKSDVLCAQEPERTPRPTAVIVVWSRDETRWVRCTARRIQASETKLNAFGLAAKRRADYA